MSTDPRDCPAKPEPFHPSASHVEPGYRDGWNAALRACAAEITRLTAELEEARKDAWQPIETAPKDGSEFIAWWIHPGGPIGAISTHWLDNTNTRTPWAGWRAPSMRVMHPGGKPTHWMPLPNSPVAAMTKENPHGRNE